MRRFRSTSGRRSILIGAVAAAVLTLTPTAAFASASGCTNNYQKYFNACISVTGTGLNVQSTYGSMTNEGSSSQYGFYQVRNCPAGVSTSSSSCTLVYRDTTVNVPGSSCLCAAQTHFFPTHTLNKNYGNNSQMCGESYWVNHTTGQSVFSARACITIHS